MAASRECEECSRVARCRLYVDRAIIVYLCRACARAFGFLEKVS